MSYLTRCQPRRLHAADGAAFLRRHGLGADQRERRAATAEPVEGSIGFERGEIALRFGEGGHVAVHFNERVAREFRQLVKGDGLASGARAAPAFRRRTRAAGRRLPAARRQAEASLDSGPSSPLRPSIEYTAYILPRALRRARRSVVSATIRGNDRRRKPCPREKNDEPKRRSTLP